MKKCNKCNFESDEFEFCPKCGSKLEKVEEKKDNILDKINTVAKNKIRYRNKISDSDKKIMIVVFSILILGAMAGIIFGKKNPEPYTIDDESSKIIDDNEDNKITDNNEIDNNENNNEEKYYGNNINAISNEKLRDNFVKACGQIKIDVSKIRNLEKKKDWNSGPRYTFDYDDGMFILYGLDNGDVSSITIANHLLDKIYLDGYEPLNVKDFIFSSDKKISLRVKAEEKIKSYLKYPSTAKFDWVGYNYARRYDVYQIAGTFKAKNVMGVEIDHEFKIEFDYSNGSATPVYLVVNKEKYIGSVSHLKEIVRKEIPQEEPKSEDGSIILKDGIIGSYGKKDKFDGEDYIRYYIPAGTYRAEALTKNAQFYVETIKLHKEDGYDNATTIKNVKLSSVGSTDEFTINKDQCISLVTYTQVKLTKIK